MKKKTLRKIVSLMILLTMLAGDFLMPAARSAKASDGAAVSGESDGPAVSGESAGPAVSGEGGEDASGEAEGPEVTVDPGEYTEPTDSEASVRQQTVWYWHKGLPPKDGREYPVLLCWDDTYYMAVDSQFLEYLAKQGLDDYYGVNFGYTEVGFSNSEWFKKKGNGNPKGRYHIEVGYPTSASNYLADLDFDYNVLKSTGTAVSFSLPSLPYIRNIGKENPDPLIGQKEEDLADRIFLGIRPTQEMIDATGRTIFVADEINWLAGMRWMDYTVYTDSFMGITYDSEQKKDYRWFLFPINSLTYNRLPDVVTGRGSFLGMKSASSVSDFLNKHIDRLGWYVSSRGSARNAHSVFSTRGFRKQTGRISYSFDDADELKRLSESNANINLAHCSGVFSSLGNRMLYTDSEMWGYLGIDSSTVGKFEFDVYYGEPNLMYFLKDDIVVENGQTQNLDGPLVIEEGTTITVKNGGVLSFTDWIVNRGAIIVEKGGSMIVQPNTTANGYTRNCALVGSNKNATMGGRIKCDGIMIVMPGCTVAGAGLYGIEFGPGAQCANYGSLISENWNVSSDHTVENRVEESYVFIGWSIVDSGFYLTSMKLSQSQESMGYYFPSAWPHFQSGWMYGKYGNNFRERSIMPDGPAPVIFEP